MARVLEHVQPVRLLLELRDPVKLLRVLGETREELVCRQRAARQAAEAASVKCFLQKALKVRQVARGRQAKRLKQQENV